MSTRTVRFAPHLLALALTGGLSVPAMAQQSAEDEDIVGPMLEEARKTYRVDEPEPERPADCPEAVGNEILVCAPIEGDPDRYRIGSSLDKGDDSHLSWDGQPPNVDGPGIFKGPATVGGLCFIPPCPKDPVYVVDVAALPEGWTVHWLDDAGHLPHLETGHDFRPFAFRTGFQVGPGFPAFAVFRDERRAQQPAKFRRAICCRQGPCSSPFPQSRFRGLDQAFSSGPLH